ncbi:MAG: hypothetical protein ACRDRD_20760 [Pseudonocardiaceae bacterium]
MVANWSPVLFWLVVTGCLMVASPVFGVLTVLAALGILIRGGKR